MTKKERDSNKELFISIAKDSIRKEGAADVLTWLDDSDFYEAPASTKYHGSYPGGLAEHSIRVHSNLIKLNDAMGYGLEEESMVITSLFHDICKANIYKVKAKNRKDDKTGEWKSIPYYDVEDPFPAGHGEKSVFILQKYMSIEWNAVLAIRWHMGITGSDDYVSKQSFNSASLLTPLVLALHMSDMMDSHSKEVQPKEE